jgi:hypothetical protein
MQLTNQQLSELWRQKLVFYYDRKKGGSLGGTMFVLGIFLFLMGAASEFDRQIMQFSILFYVVYFFFFMFLDRKINSIKSSRIPKEKAVALKVLLLAAQDLSVMAVIMVTFIAIGTLELASIVMWEFFPVTITAFWLSILIFGMMFSPFRLKYKASRKQSENFKYLPQLIAISTSLPGLALFIFTIVPTIKGFDAKLLMYMILSFVLGCLTLPFTIWGIHELLYLSLHEWPRVEKVSSGFEVSFQVKNI